MVSWPIAGITGWGKNMEKGAHVQGTILYDWQKAVDDASTVGFKYMVCAYLSGQERGDLDHYKKLADIFNKAGRDMQKIGNPILLS